MQRRRIYDLSRELGYASGNTRTKAADKIASTYFRNIRNSAAYKRDMDAIEKAQANPDLNNYESKGFGKAVRKEHNAIERKNDRQYVDYNTDKAKALNNG